MKLVDDARNWWRWHSTWIAAVMAALPLAWSELPDDLKAYIPEAWGPWIASGMFVVFMVGRLRKQTETEGEEPDAWEHQ